MQSCDIQSLIHPRKMNRNQNEKTYHPPKPRHCLSYLEAVELGLANVAFNSFLPVVWVTTDDIPAITFPTFIFINQIHPPAISLSPKNNLAKNKPSLLFPPCYYDRHKQLKSILVVTQQFHETLEPLSEWLAATEKHLANSQPIGTQTAKLEEQIAQHKVT